SNLNKVLNEHHIQYRFSMACENVKRETKKFGPLKFHAVDANVSVSYDGGEPCNSEFSLGTTGFIRGSDRPEIDRALGNLIGVPVSYNSYDEEGGGDQNYPITLTSLNFTIPSCMTP